MSTHKIYFAGALFTTQELTGNVELAHAIYQVSKGKFQSILPQDLEFTDSPKDIRDLDLWNVLHADLGIFQFNGLELDSGTVAEFKLAKFADIPAVVLRTDFRNGGDQEEDPWNLMLSNYPRTVTCKIDSMKIYKKALLKAKGSSEKLTFEHQEKAKAALIHQVALETTKALEEALKMPPHMNPTEREVVQNWLGRYADQSANEKAMSHVQELSSS